MKNFFYKLLALIMPYVGYQDVLLSIGKLVVFEVGRHKHVGFAMDGIRYERTATSTAQCYTKYFFVFQISMTNNGR